VKICPECEAELRDSVIRCVRCGHSFRPPPAAGVGAPPGDSRLAQAPTPLGRTAAVATEPRQAAPPVERPDPGNGTAADRARAAAEAWSAPAVKAPAKPVAPPPGGRMSQIPDPNDRRALPNTRRRADRPDVVLILCGLVTGTAIYLAWSAIPLRWVRIAIADGDPTSGGPIGQTTFHATDATVGTLLHGTLIALGVMAVLWLFFGLQRGWTMPWFASPVIAILISIAALAITLLASELWVVWRQAVYAGAERYHETTAALRTFLEDPDQEPVVTIQRLSGPGRFGTFVLVALGASCVAWWAYHKRDA
jgi:hypothetical protein